MLSTFGMFRVSLVKGVPRRPMETMRQQMHMCSVAVSFSGFGCGRVKEYPSRLAPGRGQALYAFGAEESPTSATNRPCGIEGLFKPETAPISRTLAPPSSLSASNWAMNLLPRCP